MKKLLFIAVAAVSALLVSCKPDQNLPGNPPTLEVTAAQSALMGSSVQFTASVSGEANLSVLEVKLLFDDTVVSEKTIRLKEEGEFTESIDVPLLKNIPDGDATLKFKAVDVTSAKTEVEKTVAVTRPHPESIIAVCGTQEFTFPREGDSYVYKLTDNFPAAFNCMLKISDAGEELTLGATSGSIAVSTEPIPVRNAIAGSYEVSFNLLDLSFAPKSVSNVTGVCELKKGQNLTESFGIDGLGSWKRLDRDYFTVDEATSAVLFNAVDGLYKLEFDASRQSIGIMPMADETTPMGYDEEKNEGAVYAYGEAWSKNGKDINGYDGTTDASTINVAQVGPHVYQLTLVGGSEYTWLSEMIFQTGRPESRYQLVGADYAEVDYQNELLTMSYNTGNSYNANYYGDTHDDIVKDQGYRFTLDLTDGVHKAKLKFELVEVKVEAALDITVNGVTATKISDDLYIAENLKLKKGDTFTFGGADASVVDWDNWWKDPDHLYNEGGVYKFNCVPGVYSVRLYIDKGYAQFDRRSDDGTHDAYFSKFGATERAIWFKGNTIANWKYANSNSPDAEGNNTDTNVLGFSANVGYSIAQIEPLFYQFTGIAVDQFDTETLNGRFRYDFMEIKYYGQNGWNDEMGYMWWKETGKENILKYTDRALELLKPVPVPTDDYPNQFLKDGVQLEKGATYVFTISIDEATKTETIDFYKK